MRVLMSMSTGDSRVSYEVPESADGRTPGYIALVSLDELHLDTVSTERETDGSTTTDCKNIRRIGYSPHR